MPLAHCCYSWLWTGWSLDHTGVCAANQSRTKLFVQSPSPALVAAHPPVCVRSMLSLSLSTPYTADMRCFFHLHTHYELCECWHINTILTDYRNMITGSFCRAWITAAWISMMINDIALLHFCTDTLRRKIATVLTKDVPVVQMVMHCVSKSKVRSSDFCHLKK